MASIPQLVGFALALYVGWRLLRALLFKSSLDKIPGVASDSFFSGKPLELSFIYRLTTIIGNISTMFHPRAGWAFQKRQAAFGRVSTLYGLFGVSQGKVARTAIH